MKFCIHLLKWRHCNILKILRRRSWRSWSILAMETTIRVEFEAVDCNKTMQFNKNFCVFDDKYASNIQSWCGFQKEISWLLILHLQWWSWKCRSISAVVIDRLQTSQYLHPLVISPHGYFKPCKAILNHFYLIKRMKKAKDLSYGHRYENRVWRVGY